MRRSIRHAIVAIAVVVGAAGTFTTRADEPAAGATTKPASGGGLALLEPLVGAEYRIEATWTAGDALKGREVYEWGVGRKFISCKTYVTRPDGSEYQRYDTIFGEEDGRLTAYTFSYDGKYEMTPVKVEGKVLKLESERNGMLIRQTLDLTDVEAVEWKVAVARAGGEPQQVMDGVWKRVK